MSTMMGVDDCRRLFEPHFERLVRVLTGGPARYFGIDAEVRHGLSEGARAFMIHDYQVALARGQFSGLDDVTPVDRPSECFRLVFANRAVVRFNLLDASWRPTANSTKLSRDFLNQQQFVLPDPSFPQRLTNLVAGHVLNVTKTYVERLGIVCPAGRGIAWHFEIPWETEGGLGVVAAHPVDPADSTGLVRPRPAAERQANRRASGDKAEVRD